MKIRFEVLGKKWKLRILSSSRYNRKHGLDSLAITVMYKRRIDVHALGVDLETLIHELVHAYLYEMCFKSTNDVSVEDLEEVFAELMAKRGREILDLGDKLLTSLKNNYNEKIIKKGLDKAKKPLYISTSKQAENKGKNVITNKRSVKWHLKK